MKYEKINQPTHYKGRNGLYAQDVIEAFDLNFSLGSALKYILRAGKKPGESFEEDLRKAIAFLERDIQRDKSHRSEEDSNQ